MNKGNQVFSICYDARGDDFFDPTDMGDFGSWLDFYDAWLF